MDDLAASVQINCDISDARHAGDSTMCIYLMRMREHYRWSEGISPGRPFDHKSLGAWIDARESYLSSLEQKDYEPLHLTGGAYDPFDSDRINAGIRARGLVYCAGYGRRGKPVFCLGELVDCRVDGDNEIVILGAEYAREMSAPVAVSRQNKIFVRKDAFLRLVWEMFDEWSWRKPRNAFFKAVSCFGGVDNPPEALQLLAEHELRNLVLHECGEILAGNLLGGRWQEMLSALTNTPLELPVRYVRDHLADSLTLLPKLVAEQNEASIHFYFAGTHPVREQLFPSLKDAYRDWDESGSTARILSLIQQGRDHWLNTGQLLMDEFERSGADNPARFQSVIERCAL